MFGFGRARRRRQVLDGPFPPTWTELLEQNLVHWALLDDDERSRLQDLIGLFLVDKKWQAARRFDLTDEVRVRRGEGGPLLDPYGGVNPGEFFAVATELFFDRPGPMQRAKPDLYDVLRGFYLQDPAERERAAHHRRA